VLERTALDVEEQLLRVVVAFQGRIQNQQQQLQLEIAPNLPLLSSHEASFNRILTELLHNACKYTPTGEQIAIAAQRCPPAPDTNTAAPAPPPARLQIVVANTGVEIAATECDRIFEEFYRIPANDCRQQGGTGLGLSLVKKLVIHLGGTIEVASAENRTAFTLYFPLA
jgi:signal transduction histidine kinase